MKKILCSIVFLFAIRSMGISGSVTFDEFAKMSESQQQKIIEQASPAFKRELYRWQWRMEMGESTWQYRLKMRMVDSVKNFLGFENLFITQNHIWGIFYQQTIDKNKQTEKSLKEQQLSNDAVAKEFQIVTKRKSDDFEVLVKLAPGPAAQALNAKAEALGNEIRNRFPRDNDGAIAKSITRKDLKSMDFEINEIREAMKKLPEWTPEQIKAAIDALPEEDPHR